MRGVADLAAEDEIRFGRESRRTVPLRILVLDTAADAPDVIGSVPDTLEGRETLVRALADVPLQLGDNGLRRRQVAGAQKRVEAAVQVG